MYMFGVCWFSDCYCNTKTQLLFFPFNPTGKARKGGNSNYESNDIADDDPENAKGKSFCAKFWRPRCASIMSVLCFWGSLVFWLPKKWTIQNICRFWNFTWPFSDCFVICNCYCGPKWFDFFLFTWKLLLIRIIFTWHPLLYRTIITNNK